MSSQLILNLILRAIKTAACFGLLVINASAFEMASSKQNVNLQNFIITQYSNLQKDAARGGGEFVDSLSALLKCRKPNLIGQFLQKNYAVFFSGGLITSEVDANQYEKFLINNAQLRAVCAQ